MFTSYLIDIINMYYIVLSKSEDTFVTFTKETKCQNENFLLSGIFLSFMNNSITAKNLTLNFSSIKQS